MSTMSRSENSVGPEAVLAAEQDELIKRRRAAGFHLSDDHDEARDEIAKTTVGLALSGGGIRSACFNLGLLQAMFRRGLLRNVDYLSTVSGGGYVGSYLSSLALRCRGSHIFSANEPEEHAQTPDAEDVQEVRQSALSSEEHERYTARRLRFLRGGRYLAKPVRFINRWLIGVFLINVVFFSAMVSAVTALALMFRMLDLHRPMIWIGSLGFKDDVRRALFPAFLMFIAWLIAWGVSYWRSGSRATGMVARVLALFLITSFLLALAGLIGTGDIDLTQITTYAGLELEPTTITAMQTAIGIGFACIVLMGLLPFFRPDLLIRSGLQPHNPVERVIFWFAARALLVGFPLVLFAVMARENISGYNESRTHLDSADVSDAVGFWEAIDQVRGPSTDDAKQLLAHKIWLAAEEYKQKDPAYRQMALDDYLRLAKLDRARATAIDETLPFWQRWLLLGDCWHHYHDNKLRQIADLRLGAMERSKGIFKQVSDDVLFEPNFWTLVTDGDENILRPFATDDDTGNSTDASASAHNSDAERRLVRRAETQQVLFEATDETSAELAELQDEICRTNRELFKAYFQPYTREQTPVYANVVAAQDQKTRAWILLIAFLVFLISSAIVDMNDTSMHGFYRNQLAQMWIEEVPGMGRLIPLAQMETTAKGAPYHLLSATINSLGPRSTGTELRQRQFLFSYRYCGSVQTGYRRTDDYMAGRYDLGNAMALSGAAVSPVQFANPLVSLLLLLLNFRLGQWLCNPAQPQRPSPVTPLRLMCNVFRRQGRYCFLTDGGHYENLGIEPLLKRRCRLIIACDATCDPSYTFSDLIRLHRRARVEDGIRFYSLDGHSDLSLTALQPADDESRESPQHFFAARIAYPAQASADGESPVEWGLLIYVKPTFTGDEGIEVAHHRMKSSVFPHDTTANQLYTEEKFEAYNQLGNHIGEALCRAGSQVSDTVFDFEQLAESLIAACAGYEGPAADRSRSEQEPAVEQQEADVRVAVSRLPNSTSPEAIASLICALASKHEEVRTVAGKLLLDVDTEQSMHLEALLAGMEAEDPVIRARVVRVLRDLDPLPQKVHAALQKHRRDGDKSVCAAVQRALAKIDDRRKAKAKSKRSPAPREAQAPR